MALGAALAAAGVMLWPAKYEAETILLLDSSSDASGLLAVARGMDFFGGGSGLGGLLSRQSGYSYREIIESRRLLTSVINSKPSLSSRSTYLDILSASRGTGPERLDEALRRLRKAIKCDFDAKSSLLRVRVRYRDPNAAAELANLIAAELKRFNTDVRTTRAHDATAFVADRVSLSASDLAAAERQLAEFHESNARIGNSPRLLLQQKRLERQVRHAEDLFSLLSRELEMARIQEKRETPVFTVVDEASPPVERDGLPPFTAAALGGLTAVLAGAFLNISIGVRALVNTTTS